MKKIIRLLLFTALSFTATGCLDIIEEIFLNKDGSGTYVYTFDITKAADAFSIVDSTGQTMKDTKNKLDSAFEGYKKNFSGISGVSALYLDKSKKYITTLSLNFANINVLNEVIDLEKKEASDKNLYSQSKGKLTRKDGGLRDLLGDTDVDDPMMSPFLSEMKYKIIYHLPSSVKKMTNENATLSDDKKTVSLEVSFEDVKKKNRILSNEIKY